MKDELVKNLSDIYGAAMNNKQLSLFKRLAFMWFGLIALNIALNLPGVEELFQSTSRVEGYASSENCITEDTYTSEKGTGDSLLFAFLNSVAGSALDDEDGTGKLAGYLSLVGPGCLKEKVTLRKSYIFTYKIRLRSRAPPVV